jgi:hypothetical protein
LYLSVFSFVSFPDAFKLASQIPRTFSGLSRNPLGISQTLPLASGAIAMQSTGSSQSTGTSGASVGIGGSDEHSTSPVQAQTEPTLRQQLQQQVSTELPRANFGSGPAKELEGARVGGLAFPPSGPYSANASLRGGFGMADPFGPGSPNAVPEKRHFPSSGFPSAPVKASGPPLDPFASPFGASVASTSSKQDKPSALGGIKNPFARSSRRQSISEKIRSMAVSRLFGCLIVLFFFCFVFGLVKLVLYFVLLFIWLNC